MATLEATDVVREYVTGSETVRALKGVDLTIERGEFLSIIGPSGSGKSTLLNVLGLLDLPTSGTVTYEGTDVAALDDRERTTLRKEAIGFVFQRFFLVPTLTATENVELPRLLEGEPAETEERAVGLLERVGLGHRLDHFPSELSGGQKQRVAIARSLVNRPGILLADEPTGNLDRTTGRQILDLFQEITEEDDVAVVTVTHDALFEEYADRTVELVDGEIQ
ncbi:MAG: ABC transporter ATP-binding protein [Halanaeroarchaeum sp.]